MGVLLSEAFSKLSLKTQRAKTSLVMRVDNSLAADAAFTAVQPSFCSFAARILSRYPPLYKIHAYSTLILAVLRMTLTELRNHRSG
jgi:hypothetical protein